MKKVILLLSFVSTFAACGQNAPIKNDNDKNTSVAERNNKASQAKEIKINEELVGDFYKGKSKETVILLIAGSGPTDRNGNSMGISQNNSLKYLAEGLSEQDFNVFTYDKRVVYLLKNQKEIPDLDFQHGIDDAETIINFLKTKMKFKNVIVAGHSEGSLVGMIAAQKNAAAFISLAGAGNSIDIILTEQLNKQAPMFNDEVSRILKELKSGNKVADVNPMLQSLFGEQNQTFLIEWISLNPAKEIEKLKIPVLIINGTKDIQVSVQEAEILHQANPKSEVVIIENMNHIFKKIEKDEDNLKSYSNPKLDIDIELINIITKFLHKNKF